MGVFLGSHRFGGGGGPPPGTGGEEWEVIAALTAPTSGKFTFAALDLSGYDYVEILCGGITTGTASTQVRMVLKVGVTPTVASHTWGGYSLSSSNSDDQANGAAAAFAALVTGTSGAFPLGNTAGDAWGGEITIDAPGDTGNAKSIRARSQHGYSGSDNAGLNQMAGSITNTDPITEIVIEGSANLTAGRVVLLGHPKVP